MTKQNYSTRMDGENEIALEDVEDGEAGKAGRPVVGRESEYREEYAVQAMKLCRLGATYEDLADFFGVTCTTLNRWQCTHPEFRDSVKRGKIIADVAAASRLYTRACGYSCKAVKIITHKGITHRVEYMKHYPPYTYTDCQKILPKRDSWGFEFWPRNFLSVKVFRMDLEADFKRLFVVGFGC